MSRTKTTHKLQIGGSSSSNMPTEQQPNQTQLDKGEVVAQDVDVDVHDSKKFKCPLWFVPSTTRSQVKLGDSSCFPQ